MKIHCLQCGELYEQLGPRNVDKNGEAHTPGKFYCGVGCSGLIWKLENNARKSGDRPPVVGHCIWCGKPILIAYGKSGYTNGQKFCSPECFEYYAFNSGDHFTVQELLDWLPEGQRYCLDRMFKTEVKERFGKREGYLLTDEVRKKSVIDLYTDDGISRVIDVGGMGYIHTGGGLIHFSLMSRFMLSVWKRRCGK